MITLIDHVLSLADRVAAADSINCDLKQGVKFQGHTASSQNDPVSNTSQIILKVHIQRKIVIFILIIES